MQIKSERYLNPEEKKLEDERRRREKEKNLATKVQPQLQCCGVNREGRKVIGCECAWRTQEVGQLEAFVSVLQGDNLRTRALDNMMGGALEGKKEDVLQMVGHIFHMHFFFNYLQNCDCICFCGF